MRTYFSDIYISKLKWRSGVISRDFRRLRRIPRGLRKGIWNAANILGEKASRTRGYPVNARDSEESRGIVRSNLLKFWPKSWILENCSPKPSGFWRIVRSNLLDSGES